MLILDFYFYLLLAFIFTSLVSSSSSSSSLSSFHRRRRRRRHRHRPRRRHLQFTTPCLSPAALSASPLYTFCPFTARPALSTRAPRPSAPRHPLNSPTQRLTSRPTFLPSERLPLNVTNSSTIILENYNSTILLLELYPTVDYHPIILNPDTPPPSCTLLHSAVGVCTECAHHHVGFQQ